MKSNLNTIIREKGNISFSVFFYEDDIFLKIKMRNEKEINTKKMKGFSQNGFEMQISVVQF